jgi:hypothetical protein
MLLVNSDMSMLFVSSSLFNSILMLGLHGRPAMDFYFADVKIWVGARFPREVL